MGYWDQKGRPAIIAAVEAACDAVAETLAVGGAPVLVGDAFQLLLTNRWPLEMRERDRIRHAFLADEVDRLKATATRVTELERENMALTREVHQLKERLKQQPASALAESCIAGSEGRLLLPGRNGKRQPLGELPLNVNSGNPQPTEGPDFTALEKANADLVKKLEVKRAAARYLKDQRDAWIKYAEALEKKVTKLKGKTLANEKPDIPVPTVFQADPEDENGSIHEAPVLSSFISNPEQDSGPTIDPEVLEVLGNSRRAASTPATLLPEYTLPEQGTDVPCLPEEKTWSGDELEETDELPSLPKQQREDNNVQVKPEPSSDNPVVISERMLRKRKNFDTGSSPPSSRRVKAEHTGGSDLVITAERTAFSPHSSIDLDGEQGEVMTPRKLRHLGIETPINNVLTERSRRPLQELPNHMSDEDGTPLLPSIRHNRTVDAHGGRRPGNDHDQTLANGVAALAEDSPLAFHSRSSKTGRLHSLLNQPRPENDPAASLRTPSSRDSLYLLTPMVGNPKVTPEVRIRTPSGLSVVTGSTKNLDESTSGSHRPRQKRLRERPVSELKLEDFKINPKVNNGQKYAYNEVVRSKVERAELEGCTDPNCCGRAFAMMAQSELSSGGPDILKKRENIKLLEEYMGEEAWRLGNMPVGEKQELWLDAKKQDYAKRLGKHRHRFGRPPSPPGYWNPDFPSTQEVEARRKEGQEMEKKMVEERWREATRGGGRWLFRDE